jgi:hypothetical protein
VKGPVKGLVMPSTVQAVLAARIDRLAEDERRLLQAATVIGKDLPFALLNAIADTPEDELRRRLARLQGAEFLYETRPFPDLEYTTLDQVVEFHREKFPSPRFAANGSILVRGRMPGCWPSWASSPRLRPGATKQSGWEKQPTARLR